MEGERPVTRWQRENRPPSKASVDSRPASRRGVSTPIAQPGYSSERPRIIVRPPSSVTSRTYLQSASRMATGMDHSGIPLTSQRERLISQQGLRVTKTGTSKGLDQINNRQVQDKRYFTSVLQIKIKQLKAEIENLQQKTEMDTREQAAYLVYDKRVKQMATELTDLQGKLADYNLAMDKINTGTDVNTILNEARTLTYNNEAEVNSLEAIFADRKRKEEAIAQLDAQMNKEKYKNDELIKNLSPDMKSRYNELQRKNDEVGKMMEKVKQEISLLENNKSSLSDQIYISQSKEKLLKLELKLREVEAKRDNLVTEQQNRISPDEERQNLLAKVKNDNAQMLSMEAAISEIREQIKQATASLSQADDDLLEKQAGRQNKYIELQKREKIMDDFLENVEDMKLEDAQKLKNLDSDIIGLLKNISSVITTLPTTADYNSLITGQHTVKADLLNTVKSLVAEYKNLIIHSNKVELMEKTLNSELKVLNKKTDSMKEDMVKFRNIDGLEKSVRAKKESLTEEKAQLDKSAPKIKDKWNKTFATYNHAQKQLVDSENHAQLLFLERKLATLEQSNYHLKDYLASSVNNQEIDSVKKNAATLIVHLNNYTKVSLGK